MNAQRVTVHVRKISQTPSGFFREISWRDRRGFVRVFYATGAKAATKIIRAAAPMAVITVR